MAKHRLRFWLEMFVVIAGIVCVLAVFFTTVGAANRGGGNIEPSEPPSQERPPINQTYEGVITDTHCGAKHTPAIPESAADCTRACVHSGEHFALVNGDKMYVLEGENQLLNHAAGERVTVSGTLNGNTISVTSVRLPAP
jgi:hypothetical protein